MEDKMLTILDHVELVNWIKYSSYRAGVGKTVKNFDERECLVLPSGKKITLTITVEEWKDEL